MQMMTICARKMILRNFFRIGMTVLDIGTAQMDVSQVNWYVMHDIHLILIKTNDLLSALIIWSMTLNTSGVPI